MAACLEFGTSERSRAVYQHMTADTAVRATACWSDWHHCIGSFLALAHSARLRSRSNAGGCSSFNGGARLQAAAGPGSFETEAEYAAFLRPRLRPGTRLVAVEGDRKGDHGTFVEYDSFFKRYRVQWKETASDVNLGHIALAVRPRPSSLHVA